MNNNRNFLLAMVLSIAVLVGWQFFFVNPRMQAEQAEAQRVQQENTAAVDSQNAGSSPVGGGGGAIPQAGAPAVVLSRDAALAASPRVAIDTPSLSGSLNLQGARIDDLRLKNYHETVDDSSPTIILLSPETAGPEAYFVEFGFVGDNLGSLPGPQTVWQAEAGQVLTPGTPVTLTYTNDSGIEFSRQISVDPNAMFTVTDSIANSTESAVALQPYGRVVRHSKPEVASAWVVFEGLIGFLGENGLNEVTYSKIEDEGRISPPAVNAGWLGITDKYWATALIPDTTTGFQPSFRFSPDNGGRYQTEYLGDAVQIGAGETRDFLSRTFAGPKVVSLVDGYESSLGIHEFSRLIDWGWFRFLTRPLFYVIDWIYNFTGNFGVAILVVTVLLKLIFFPLANKSYKSMAKMKNAQPQIAELREKYKDDRVKQQQEMMRIYKEEKINPAAGCWPVLVQIPVFFALYKVLYVTIEMRHAPFFGWIQDLAAPDPTSLFNLFGLIPVDLPQFLMVGVWPILMGITMFIQMKLNPTPPDPAQQMIFTWMPVLFTFMLAAFPAGLVIYWTWNNFLSIIQQSVIMKRNGTKIELWDNMKGLFRRKRKEA
ncbi:membrane protein insertase YidC [Aureimonas fodinaquatilis]|uniref:Membrane protein insertase YidC n=1 Tax=Aureimonas fodinaquatilis TaxID=2565783 RepID=A0A5B0DR36_9HYPH|nr:membrane protein insertase YidC [Aureimonas fodinaquatilis]KAA0968966.1 membrane protein insertase YidC [Aureimonas fodinaquatilis]